jgi:hypothetical protein
VADPPDATDRLLGELRAVRQDLATACASGHADTAALTAPVTALAGHAGDPVALAGVDAAHPLPVHDGDQRSTLELDAGSTGALGDAFASSVGVLHTDLWFLCGLLCALPFSYFLVRLVLARA